jgi:hypothetical protein
MVPVVISQKGVQVMRRVIAAVLTSIALPIGAYAFDNIEADVFYDGPLKEQITKEYAVTLAGLQKQAKDLGVEPREKDIFIAKRHFATKAMMMARCLDTGISIKKMILKDTDIKKFNSGCVKLQTEFISWVQIGGKISDMCWLNNRGALLKQEKPVYDFLKIETYREASHYDAIALRDCYLEENHLPETWIPRR